MALLAQVAMTALTEAGASTALARRTADAARIAAHYVIGHSGASRVCLTVEADTTMVTMTVSDYSPGVNWFSPAWLPVTSAGALYLDGVQPGTDPLADGIRGDGLQLHRSCDGHVRLGIRALWEAAATSGRTQSALS
ncbi:hypothetical protein ADK70_04490 [Streptomyces rimosus subsp. pseudoverticillatus]|uniref:hypothetical protein n=1 Tax=Streptomyces rimosus TaxID=1927 RepID=UPI0006B282CB|nr:hypothetical protein [Streptomyces rimosus]KOT99268.1 hypothetical protein ADK70_04490 [Streptomyces rimosus subsp. pseudoverticillatus]